jgi:hypothetical protein
MWHWLLIIIYLVSTFYLSVAFPLVTYALSLALFGLMHVISELSYMHQRFAHVYQNQKLVGIGIRWTSLIYMHLICILILRWFQIQQWFSLPKSTWFKMELFIVILMISTIFWLMRKSNRLYQISFGIGLVILSALIHQYPIEMVLFFSIFHNFTPIFFLWEYRKKSFDSLTNQQRQIFSLYQYSILFAFLIIPILIIQFQPFLWFYHHSLSSLKPWLLHTKSIEYHLSVFTLKSWDSAENHYNVISIFSAVVFCQLLHYAVVIHLLPFLQTWTTPQFSLNRKLKSLLLILAILGFLFFQIDFFKARQYYGLAASFHAWIELPLFLSLLLKFQESSKIKATST